MTGSILIAMVSGREDGYGVRITLQDCPIDDRDEKLMPYVEMSTEEALNLLHGLMRMTVVAERENHKTEEP